MRTYWLSGIFFLVLVGLFLFARPASTYGQDMKWGLRGGPTVSSLRGDLFALVEVTSAREEGAPLVYVTGTKVRKGVQLTGFVTLPVRNWLSVQVELQYVQKGISIELGEYENCGSPLILCRSDLLRKSVFFYRLSFLQLPALLKVRLPFGEAFSASLVGGASVGGPLQTVLATTDSWFSGIASVRTPDARGEVGAVLGVEMSYRLGAGGTIILDARLNPGLTDLPLNRSPSSVRTATGAIGLGYAFQ